MSVGRGAWERGRGGARARQIALFAGARGEIEHRIAPIDQRLTPLWQGQCLGYKFLIFLKIYHLSLLLNLQRRSNKMVYLFFRVFADEYVLAYHINLRGSKPQVINTLFKSRANIL